MTHAIAADPSLQRSTSGPGGERVYFPQLDGLRLIAFVLVYLFHQGVPQFEGWINALDRTIRGFFSTARRPPGPALGFTIRDNGWVGVQLFFILSGFLITTLLLREERRFGRIDLRSFWVRRILRIWPLYYLTLFLGFFALPWAQGVVSSSSYVELLRRHLPWFLVFLGNWSMGFGGPPMNDAITVLWSVCVEEQFYIVCPLLLALVPSRLRITAVGLLIGFSLLGRYLLAQAGSSPLLFQFNSVTQLDTLLSGVLLALLFDKYPPSERAGRLMGLLQWPVWIAVAWLLTRPSLAHETVARRTWDFVALWMIGTGVVGIALLGKGWFVRFLVYPRVVWLGKISYGLYMYHEITLWLTRSLFGDLPWFPNKEHWQAITAATLTVAVAALSYYGFERPFLKLKRRWTRVPSRPV
ncbi:MAG: acyltransferase [Isosphaeraceae bacterium]|nr:acyltransferase [Isosphaeraceae bacterium]